MSSKSNHDILYTVEGSGKVLLLKKDSIIIKKSNYLQRVFRIKEEILLDVPLSKVAAIKTTFGNIVLNGRIDIFLKDDIVLNTYEGSKNYIMFDYSNGKYAAAFKIYVENTLKIKNRPQIS